MRLRSKVIKILLLLVAIGTPCYAQEQAKKDVTFSSTGLVYFTRNNSLWVYDLATAQERQITRDKKITSYCVSKDGSKLAYFVDSKQLYSYDFTTSKEDFLVEIKTDLTNPSFSPDGNQLVLIAYSAAPMKNRLHFLSNTYGAHVRHVWLLDIKSKNLRDLTPNSQYQHIFANWSQDGNWISYTSFEDPWWKMFANIEWEVFIMNVNDSQRLSYKIGKGYRSQWIAANRLAVLDGSSLKVYDTQAKQVLKQFTLKDSCDSDFSMTKDMDIIFYKTNCGREGSKTGLVMLNPQSQNKREIIYGGDDPIFIK